MEKDNNSKCKGHMQCDRSPVSDGFCEFHLPNDHKDALGVDKYDALLVEEIENSVKKDDGVYALYWHGFVFPKGHVLFGSVRFERVREKLPDCWINIQESSIQDLYIATYNIKNLILSEATIHKNTMIAVTDIDSISMGRTNFQGDFHCASKTYNFDARGAVFAGEFSFAATIYSIANFNGCRFRKACAFSGTQGKVFGDESSDEFKKAGFDHVIFGRPSDTIYQDVDLRRASFKSTSLVGIRFYNTNFYQKSLNRNGIYNELHKLNDSDKYKGGSIRENYYRKIRHVIHEYRQLRMSMESNKDYIKSHDFYIGEMEARQRRKWSFILALYRFSSFYGTDYVRGFFILIGLFFVHWLVSTTISMGWQVRELFYGPQIIAAWKGFGDITLHSLSVITLQRSDMLSDLSFFQKTFDILFRILFPVQTAMFVLALRNKTKR